MFAACAVPMQDPTLPTGVAEDSASRGLVRRLFLWIRGEQEGEDESVIIVASRAATLQSPVAGRQSPEQRSPVASRQSPVNAVNDDSARPEPVEGRPTTDVCGPAPMLPVQVCEAGAGFLCLDTPPGGVVDDAVIVHGLVDRRQHAYGGMKIVAQHEATRTLVEIATQSPLTNACATAALTATQPFCLEETGAFAMRIPLTQLGVYTVSAQAFRLGEDPEVKSVRVSRVIAPRVTAADITIDPDPTAHSGVVAAEQVTLAIDLLRQCEQCDFIGSATGATHVTVANTITLDDGPTQRVSRVTNQGSDGRFTLCMPIGAGENRLEVTVCNAATGLASTHCPRVTLPMFRGGVSRLDVRFQWPGAAATPVFSAAEYPDRIPIHFTVAGLDTATASTTGADATQAMCVAGPVTLEWNRDRPIPLTATADGYRIDVQPEVGINVGVVHVRNGSTTVDFPFTVGWGELFSPWLAPGQLRPEDDLWFNDAWLVGVRKTFMAETVRGLINHIAVSDQLTDLLQELTARPAEATTERARWIPPDRVEAIRSTIPTCTVPAADDAFAQWRTELLKPPRIGRFEISRIEFVPDAMKLTIDLRDVDVALRVFRDADRDGLPDFKVLPLRLQFRHLVIFPEVRLIRGAAPYVVITSPYDDCAFKSGTYCKKQPALIIPKHFAGGATPSGGFVTCDTEGQAVDEVVERGCEGLNSFNGQTGLFNEAVLDAVNRTVYCDGSAALTYLLREGLRQVTIDVGCPADGKTGPWHFFPCGSAAADGWMRGRHWSLPVGLDLVRSLLTVNERGMSARVASRVGSSEWYRQLPSAIQQPTTGFFDDPGTTRLPVDAGANGERDISVALAEGLLNQYLFLFAEQGDPTSGTGILDWDLHEPFFRGLGFDFAAECDPSVTSEDASAKKSRLCFLRPRVGDLLGSPLTTAGYFSPRQPLMIRIRGNRQMSPRIRFYRAAVPVEGGEETASPVASRQSPVNAVTGDQRPATSDRSSSARKPATGDAVPSSACGEVPPSSTPTRTAQLVEFQLPELEMSFYALQTDSQGAPLLDAGGKPIIQSMRPGDPDPAKGAIVRFYATLLLTFEFGELNTDPDDPSQWVLPVRTNPKSTRIVFRIPPGGNSTIVSNASLLAAFREQLLVGVQLYAKAADALRVKLPKAATFATTSAASNDIMRLLGLAELRVSKEGLVFGVDEGQDYFDMNFNLHLLQRLLVDGQTQEWEIPAP